MGVRGCEVAVRCNRVGGQGLRGKGLGGKRSRVRGEGLGVMGKDEVDGGTLIESRWPLGSGVQK